MTMGTREVAIGIAGAGVIRVLGASWRIEMIDEHMEARARQSFPNVIFALWHGRLLPMAWTHRNRGVYMMVSQHRDGEMIAQATQRLGFNSVRGSSTRGGAPAIREMVRVLREGHDVGITVDGPVGPARKVKPGALEIARQSGAAIVPITASSRHHRAFGSWDGFEVPAPFTKIVVRCGEPISVPASADEGLLEAKRLELESRLTTLTAESDGSV